MSPPGSSKSSPRLASSSSLPSSSTPAASRKQSPDAFADLCARYQLEMDPDSVPGLIERFDLRFPSEPL